MLIRMLLGAVLVTFVASSPARVKGVKVASEAANAMQREAILHKVELPGAKYSIVVAMAKPGSTAISLRGQPDPTVAYIADGALVLGIDHHVEKMMKDIGALLHPSCTFHADGIGNGSPNPVAIYIVPNDASPVVRPQDAALESLSPRMQSPVSGEQVLAPEGKTRTMSLTRMEPRGAEFDIVFGVTKFPDTGKLTFKYDGEESELFTAIVPMLTPRCITHVQRTDRIADVIAVYAVPKQENLGPPMQ